MNVAVLHGAVPADANLDEQDVLVQVATVSQALRELGYHPVAVPLSLDLGAAAATLQQLRPQFVFNLVETVQGRGQYIHLGPALLDGLHLPYTGASAASMLLTSNKLLSKKWLTMAHLPTPQWLPAAEIVQGQRPFPGPYIIKSVWEHGSVGLDDTAVVADAALLTSALIQRQQSPAAPWFVERYIPGREFNLALLAGPEGPELLPPAEIEFREYPADKVHIVGYNAKWYADSFEYQHTFRRFDFPPHDAALLARLTDLALSCWQLFELRGYARVDVRIDTDGEPWILEVNANPCVAPDSGFIATAQHAGLQESDVIRRIVADTCPSPTVGGTVW
jgi:D-alanine-D-alanine ligase